jgi:hypothetical protein
VCGGPLVPSEGVERAHGELGSLVKAQRARAIAVGWTAAVVLFACVAVMGAGLGALLWSSSHLAAWIMTGIGAGAALLGIVSRVRAGRRNAEARVALDDAWQRAANDVLRARGGELTAADLAQVMRTDEEHAEVLLSGLSAVGRARVEVRDDAELAYRVATGDVADDEPAPPANQKAR